MRTQVATRSGAERGSVDPTARPPAVARPALSQPTPLALVVTLQRAAGNAAASRLLDGRRSTADPTVQCCGDHVSPGCPCADESTEEEAGSAGATPVQPKLQRAVTESVVTEPSPLRPRPSVCLVHLHGNETGALRAAQALVPRCDVNLVHLDSTTRHIHVSVGSQICEADPNRIFSDAALARLWPTWNRGACATDPVKAEGIRHIVDFRDQQLWPAIRRGMGVPGTLAEEMAEGVCREGAPVAAFHNNDASSSIDILSYCPGGSGPAGCGSSAGREARAGATDTSVPGNPHVEPTEDKDDFFLVTRRADFDALVAQHRNVVLQPATVRDDGSLSVRFAFGRYANVEAELGGQAARNEAMGEQAITQLGARCRPPGAAGPQGSGGTPVQRQPSSPVQRQPPPGTAGPESAERPGTLATLLRWLGHLYDEIVRVLQQLGTMPEPLPRETPPRGLPAGCRSFADQAALDAAKNRITSSVIARMPERDVISWIVGLAAPPPTVTREAEAQRDCMLAAIRIAARRPGSPLRLSSGPPTRSGRRDFGQQRAIWERKFTFLDRAHGGRPFDRVSDRARGRCGALVGSDTRWDPDNADHRTCWLSTLTADERQQEILGASSAPGISRHHWGTDFDLFDPDMNPVDWEAGGAFADEYSWMMSNAATYGFIQSFTATSTFMSAGYIEERWHWSYYPAAQALLEFARGHQSDVEARLMAEWGSAPEFSHIQTEWRKFMFNVSERGQF